MTIRSIINQCFYCYFAEWTTTAYVGCSAPRCAFDLYYVPEASHSGMGKNPSLTVPYIKKGELNDNKV